ncbi:MAG: GAF domain-containing protein, partial [Gammaproteobacteria bacterium]|nr:GAF domain-containing protein [Gammaproteobacteria bacterium]
TGQPVLCNDITQDSRYQPHKLLPKTRSELTVPLKTGAVVVGVLDVQCQKCDAFEENDLTTLQILGGQVAIAIENARLFRDTQRQVELMRVLHSISLDITSQLDSEQLLATILEQATHLLSAQGSSLSVYDSQADLIHRIAVHNLPSKYQGMALRVGEGTAGQVVATGQPVIVNDYQQWTGRSPTFQDSPYDAIVSVPLHWENQVFGALCTLDHSQQRSFTEDDVQLLSLFADLASMGLKSAELYAQVVQLNQHLEQKVEQRTSELVRVREEVAHKADQLQQLLAATVRIQEEERGRIARDLHDGSNQLITGTLYEIQAAQESIMGQRWEIALEKLQTAKNLLRQIEAENRCIIFGLRPPILDTKGLLPALKWQVDTHQKHYGTTCAFQVFGRPTRLAPEVEATVYRIVQESLNNVATHAQAQSVQMRIDFGSAHLCIAIRDDGVGFDSKRVLTEAPGQMGLIGMQERAQSIGGQLEVRSSLGSGAKIELDVPLPTNSTPRSGLLEKEG